MFGCFFGTLIGALPGLGPVNGVAIVLPFAYSMGLDPAAALMLLAGIYYGAEYGGRISSILLNIPGDAGAVMTTLDGHPLAQQGQAGRALALSALASFVGSLVALTLLVLATPVLADLALAFGPRDYVALLIFAFVCLARVSDAPIAKTLAALSLGLLLAMVGIDSGTGVFRLTFGIPNLFDGVDMLVVIVGLFAISEMFALVARSLQQPLAAMVDRPKGLLAQLLRLRWTLARGSLGPYRVDGGWQPDAVVAEPAFGELVCAVARVAALCACAVGGDAYLRWGLRNARGSFRSAAHG